MKMNGGGEDMLDGCFPSKNQQQASMDCNVSQQDDQMYNSQPATQPLDDSFGMDDDPSQEEEKAWGQLYPHCGTFPRIALRTDNFKLGRAKTSDYVIRESDMGSNRWLTAVSKVQCEIIKNKTGVFLKDRSSNGTWVNGNKVGKDKMWPLEHNAEICFAGSTKKVFVFMSSTGQTETFPSQLTQKYTVSKVLGRGACGEVRLGFRIPDLHRVAIKVICKRTTNTVNPNSSTTVLNEVRILQSVSHPCVINLEDVIDTMDYLFIVLELAEGGELFDKIIERTKLNEAEAKLHFYQIASAIKYLHAMNICHRDLKPENVLLCSVDDTNPVIKITDMGLSKLVDLGTVLKTFCGTPQYIAPEIVASAGLTDAQYSLKVDCWSMGVILYILVSGTPPFSDERQCGLPLRQQIIQANYQFYPQLFDQISAPGKDLIRKLLKANPEERISAEEVLQHPWLQDPAMLRRAHGLMSTQTVKGVGRKRVLDTGVSIHREEKRSRQQGYEEVDTGCSVSVFKTPVGEVMNK